MHGPLIDARCQHRRSIIRRNFPLNDLSAAFAELQLLGYIVAEDYTCCAAHAVVDLAQRIGEGIAHGRLQGETIRGLVFYTGLEWSEAVAGGFLRLYYGPIITSVGAQVGATREAIGAEVCSQLRRYGLDVHWDGDPRSLIKVDPKSIGKPN